MPKAAVTPTQHIAALNARLRSDECYRDGMAFIPYPEGATGDSIDGYSVIGSIGLLGIYARVAHEVSEQLGLD